MIEKFDMPDNKSDKSKQDIVEEDDMMHHHMMDDEPPVMDSKKNLSSNEHMFYGHNPADANVE